MFGVGELGVHRQFVARLFADRRRRRDSERWGNLFPYDNLKLTFSAGTQDKKGNNFASLHIKLLSCPHKRKKKKKHPEKIMQWCSVCPSIFYSPLRSPNQGQKDLWPGIFREATALTVKRRPPCILLCSEVKTSNRAVKSVRRPTATCALISN